MRIPGWIPNSIHIPPLTKRDTLLLSALFIFNFIVYSSWVELGQVATRPWLLLVWLYGLLGLAPLAWRDKAPLTVFATQWVLATAAWPIMSLYIPMVGIVVAMYSVAAHHSRGVSLLALLASCIPLGLELAAMLFANAHYHGHTPFEIFFTNGALLVGAIGWAWGFGRVTQANQRRLHDLERERESAREEEVLSTERRRIARELHDIVSHAVTVIVLQAAGAARVAKTDFPQVIRSLTHIEITGKQAMSELRRLLGVLADSSPAGDPSSNAAGTNEFKPQPGLADLPELLTSLHNAGMPVSVQTEGTPLDLDSSIDLTAYRIVQEGLVNVLKHAGKHANPRLRLAWEDHNLLIQIDNDTATTVTRAIHSGGRGLVGLRERAHAAGGNLHAGPHRQGGYRLTATIPLATPGVSPVPRASHRGQGDQGKVSV
ncbi:MAG: sensor histidine kinase [Pseudonocardiaceae bacterium]